MFLVILFGGMVITIALAWWPRGSAFAGGDEWPKMKERFLDVEPHEAFMAALSDCLTATEHAVTVNRIKGKWVRAAAFLFVAELLILILLLVTLAPVP